jgi:photosystem II stability/assembly factor-like uncharacterized protein
VIYLAAGTTPREHQGGIYKTVDGGQSWTQLLNDQQIAGTGYTHGMFVTLHPDRPDWVYFSTGNHGLHLSKDAGKTWKHLNDIPFQSITRVAFDPNDPNTMYVTTFGGGVWRGPAE